jgi:hypothetical protein
MASCASLSIRLEDDMSSTQRPLTEDESETEMYYSEALLWIDALEWFIRRQGFEVPTWSGVKEAGWVPSEPVNL